MKANTGSSRNGNARLAGIQAAASSKETMDQIKMAYVYASCTYNLNELLAGIAEELPGIPLIGNTSFTGTITPEGYISGKDGFVSLMTVQEEDMTVGIGAVENHKDALAAGIEAATIAMKAAGRTSPPSYFYMAASPGEEEFYLRGITSVIGRVPFFGGSAADNSISGDWKIITEKGVFTNGVAVAFFYTDKEMKNKFTGAYKETSDIGIITKVENNRVLIEIDGKPAVEKYAMWRGMNAADLSGSNLLAETCTSPLGVKDRLGTLVAIRHPMNGNADGSMAVGNNLAEGTAVIRMEATVDQLIDSTGKTLEELKSRMNGEIGALHLVHCGGRRGAIDSRIEEVTELLKDAAGDIPFITEFTFGEYGFEEDGCNVCGGLMLSFTAFGK
jgi:hypothetical protein